MDSADLLERWRATGDARAFREISGLYAGMVFATCRRILGNVQDAEEVAQDCFLYLSQSKVAISSTLGGWLHTVATRRSLDRVRGDRRRVARERAFSESASNSAVAEWDDVVALVDEAIAGLDAELRDPVVAFFLEERSQSEIAESLGVSQPTVSRRIDKGLKKVRRALAKRGVAVPGVALAGFLGSQMAGVAPPTLVAGLGKLAISGTPKLLGNVTIGKTAMAGGFVVMKKITVGVALVLCALLALWFVNWGGGWAPGSRKVGSTPVEVDREAEVDMTGARGGDVGTRDSSAPAPAATPPVAPAVVEEAAEASEGPGGSVAGRVVWSRSNAPVPYRRVRAREESADRNYVGMTNAAGEFLIEGIEPGDYAIRVLDEKLTPERKPLRVFIGEETNKTGLVLKISEGATVEGHVTIAGEPAALVDLDIHQIGDRVNHGAQPVVTDEEGWYQLVNILEGERQFVGVLDIGNGARVWSNMPRVAVREGEVAVADLHFTGGDATVEGTILLNGKPAPYQSTVITFWDARNEELLGQVFLDTAETGDYRLTNVVEGRIQLEAALRLENGRLLYGAKWITARTRAGRTTRADFAFTRGGGTVEGLITLNGEPVPNANLIIFGSFSSTDEAGRYRVTDISQGDTQMWAELLVGSGKIFTSYRPVVTIKGDEVNEFDFDFPGGDGTVVGRVYTDEDAPLRLRVLANYQLEDGRDWYFSANTNSEGHFELSGLPSGPAALLVNLVNSESIPSAVIPFELGAGETLEQDVFVPKDDL